MKAGLIGFAIRGEFNNVIRDTRSSGSVLRIEVANSLGTSMGWNQQAPPRTRGRQCRLALARPYPTKKYQAVPCCGLQAV